MGIQLEISFIVQWKGVFYKSRVEVLGKDKERLFETKTIETGSRKWVEFVDKFQTPFRFVKINEIIINVWFAEDRNARASIQGEFKINLSQLSQVTKIELNRNGVSLRVHSENVPGDKLVIVKLNLDVKYKQSNNTTFQIHRYGEKNVKVKVWSDHVCKASSSERKHLDISKSDLCAGDDYRKLEFSLWDEKRNKQICSFITSLLEIENNNSKTFEFKELMKMKKQTGEFKITHTLNRRHAMEEFIQKGLNINCAIGVDFTISNKPATIPTSLHFIDSAQTTRYEFAIYNLINVLNQYDTDHEYPVFGFGAYPTKNSPCMSHCFPLSDDVHCQDINGVLGAYRAALKSVVFYGPTFLAPLIKQYIEIIKKTDNIKQRYFILVILTDGDIDDENETKAAIMNATQLPLSIIIIGIGNNDGQGFKSLVDIDRNLTLNGKKADRDIVKFVEFNKYERLRDRGEKEQLEESFRNDVLEEVPDQVSLYMAMKKIYPDDMTLDVNQVNEAIKKLKLSEIIR